MIDRKEIVVLTGKEAVGKSSLIDYLVEQGENKILKLTTRAPRSDETDGQDYKFVTLDEFIGDPTMLVSSRIGFNLYGINKEALAEHQGRVFVTLDTDGILQLERHVSPQNIRVMMISAPSQVVIQRMINRGEHLDDIRAKRRFDEMMFGNSVLQKIKSPIFKLDGSLEVPELAKQMYLELQRYNGRKAVEQANLLSRGRF